MSCALYSNKKLYTSNKGITTSNKKLLVAMHLFLVDLLWCLKPGIESMDVLHFGGLLHCYTNVWLCQILDRLVAERSKSDKDAKMNLDQLKAPGRTTIRAKTLLLGTRTLRTGQSHRLDSTRWTVPSSLVSRMVFHRTGRTASDVKRTCE